MTGDERDAPVGFSVIFPGMLARAIDMGLDIPMMTQANVDAFIRLRDTELNRYGLPLCLPSVSEPSYLYGLHRSDQLLIDLVLSTHWHSCTMRNQLVLI